MMGYATSEKSAALRRSIEPLVQFYSGGLYQQHARRPAICDFAFGNPHNPPVARLSLIASDDMVERALPALEAAIG
jgi:hypothetical protein